MEEVVRWLDLQVKRESRVIYLEDALLGNRFPGYAFYRLRYFLLRFVTGCVVHALRFLLILHVAGNSGFLGILVLHAAVSLASSTWWGLLEEMRGGVRALRRGGKPYLIPREIGRWLALAVNLGALVAGGGLVWLVGVTAVRGAAPSILEVYAFSVLLGFGINLVTRCYHSGIYALRRVYRPPVMIVLIEVVSFVILLAFWPWLKGWSLPLASALSSLAVAAFTFYYAHKAYAFFGIQPRFRVRLGRLRVPRSGRTREAWGGALAYGLMRMDSLLLLALFLAGGGRRHDLLILLFLLGPVIHAALDWAGLFYFDLKRLEIRFLTNVRRRFQRAVIVLAGALGTLFWLFSLLYGWILGRHLESLILPLGLFLVSRSLLAAYQVQMFSERAYRAVVTGGLGLVCGLSLLAVVHGSAERLLLLSALNLATMAFLWSRSKQLGPGGWGRSVLWPSEWLAEAGASDEPLRIGSGRVLPPPTHDGTPPTPERNPVPWTARLIIDLIGGRLKSHGRVTFLAPNRLIWFERKNGKRRTGRSWFVRETSGLVRWMGTSGLRDNGMRALEFAARRRTLGSLARVVEQCPREPVSLGDLKREFHAAFPDGVIYDPALPIPDALRKMDGRERRRILFAAGAYLKTLRPWSLGSRYEVTALSAHGELSLVFITQGWGERRARRQWLSRLRQYNVRAGLWGAV